MQLVKFRVEGKEYQLKKLPTEREIEALKKTYKQVNVRLKNATEAERKQAKWDYMREQLAVSGGTLTKCFGFTNKELDDMEFIVTMKLFWVLLVYFFTGRLEEFP